MTEKKLGSIAPIPDIKVQATEISVARNRAVEPYIKTFAFSPENITQESLGKLVGVFSVSDRSESSAYTVNVIASVVKKEYYINPSRGVVESFESMLHRINLALSELVKNGRTSWMGSLHGAIAVVEKDNIHFSATGEGKILLFRDGTLSDIGDGLASEEASVHPLKTFLEISSGRLTAKDCVLLATPEPLELFSPRDLERNASRLIPEGKFIRFLETAMINDLRAGAVVVLDAYEAERVEAVELAEKPKRKRAVKPETVNAWSEKAFRTAAQERTKDIVEPYDPEEDVVIPEESADIQPQSNEIRIQGEILENADEHPSITKLRWMFEDAKGVLRSTVVRSIRDTRRRGADTDDATATMIEDARESAKAVHSRLKEEQKESDDALSALQGTISFPEKRPAEIPSPVVSTEKTDESDESSDGISVLFDNASRESKSESAPTLTADRTGQDFAGKSVAVFLTVKETTARFLVRYAIPATRTAYRFICRISVIIARKIAELSGVAWRRFLALPPKKQLIFASIVAFCLTGIGIAVWSSGTEKKVESAPIVIVDTPAPAPFPPVNEKNASRVTLTPLQATAQDAITPLYFGNSPYLVSKTNVIDLTKNLAYAIPINGTIRLATGMKSLGLIFLLTDQGELYSLAPTNQTLVKNTISFPPGFKIASMGSYLTYLYFLEDGTGKVYRYPHADNGFGEGTLWTKSAMSIDTRSIAVSENIYGASTTAVSAFSRGIPVTDFSSEMPSTKLSLTASCANADLSDRVVILDAPAKRVVLFDGKGAIVSQFFNESFAESTSCAISGDGTAITVSGKTMSFMFQTTR